ncbi:hypothetical protein Dimus_033249 [Dionaea muscipula]
MTPRGRPPKTRSVSTVANQPPREEVRVEDVRDLGDVLVEEEVLLGKEKIDGESQRGKEVLQVPNKGKDMLKEKWVMSAFVRGHLIPVVYLIPKKNNPSMFERELKVGLRGSSDLGCEMRLESLSVDPRDFMMFLIVGHLLQGRTLDGFISDGWIVDVFYTGCFVLFFCTALRCCFLMTESWFMTGIADFALIVGDGALYFACVVLSCALPPFTLVSAGDCCTCTVRATTL